MDRLVTNPGQQYTADVDMALVEKYARSGPRYTSYPTAPQFGEQFPIESYLADARSHQLGALSRKLFVPKKVHRDNSSYRKSSYDNVRIQKVRTQMFVRVKKFV